jgi:hypothetical protein
MQAVIPQIEEDQIVLYAAVEDIEGFCEDGSLHIFPKSGKPSIKSYTNHYSRAPGSSIIT